MMLMRGVLIALVSFVLGGVVGAAIIARFVPDIYDPSIAEDFPDIAQKRSRRRRSVASTGGISPALLPIRFSIAIFLGSRSL